NRSASPSVASYTSPRQLNSSKRLVIVRSFTIASMALTRRAILKGLLASGVGAATSAGAYGYVYGRHELTTTRATMTARGMSPALDGLRIGLITDIHRSRWVSADDVRSAVELL